MADGNNNGILDGIRQSLAMGKRWDAGRQYAAGSYVRTVLSYDDSHPESGYREKLFRELAEADWMLKGTGPDGRDASVVNLGMFRVLAGCGFEPYAQAAEGSYVAACSEHGWQNRLEGVVGDCLKGSGQWDEASTRFAEADVLSALDDPSVDLEQVYGEVRKAESLLRESGRLGESQELFPVSGHFGEGFAHGGYYAYLGVPDGVSRGDWEFYERDMAGFPNEEPTDEDLDDMRRAFEETHGAGAPLERPSDIVSRCIRDSVPYGEAEVAKVDEWFAWMLDARDAVVEANDTAKAEWEHYMEREGINPADGIPAYAEEYRDGLAISGLSDEELRGSMTENVFDEYRSAFGKLALSPMGDSGLVSDYTLERLKLEGLSYGPGYQSGWRSTPSDIVGKAVSSGQPLGADARAEMTDYARNELRLIMEGGVSGLDSMARDAEKKALFRQLDEAEDSLNAGNGAGKRLPLLTYDGYKALGAHGWDTHGVEEYDVTVLDGMVPDPRTLVDYARETGHLWDRGLQARADAWVRDSMEQAGPCPEGVSPGDHWAMLFDEVHDAEEALRKCDERVLGTRDFHGVHDNGSRPVVFLNGPEVRKELVTIGYGEYGMEAFDGYLSGLRERHGRPAPVAGMIEFDATKAPSMEAMAEAQKRETQRVLSEKQVFPKAPSHETSGKAVEAGSYAGRVHGQPDYAGLADGSDSEQMSR